MDIFDVFAAIGVLLLGAGLWMVTPALSLSVVGSILLCLGVVGAARQRPRNRGEG